MEHLSEIIKLAEKELDVFEKNGKFRSREEIDTAYKLIDIVKDVYCIWKYQDDSDYSERGSYRSYDDYSRGRRRDSMGRYSSDNGKEEYIRQLRAMADEAPDERTRDSISRMAREMERS